MRGTSVQSQDHAISVAFTTEPRSSFEFPSFIKVRNVCKELLQLRRHHQCRACTPASTARLPSPRSWPTRRNLLPSPRSWYRRREIPDLWCAPVQGFTNSESSQLSSVSQLRQSCPVSSLRSQIILRSCNLKIAKMYCAISRLAMHSRDWHAISGFRECAAQSWDCANSWIAHNAYHWRTLPVPYTHHKGTETAGK